MMKVIEMAKRGCIAYPDTKALERKIDQYFELIEQEETPSLDHEASIREKELYSPRLPTISGLAYFLGVDRRTLSRWTNENDPERANLIEKAKSRVEVATERALYI